MANILPQDAQRKIWAMYRARFILLGSIVALALAGCAMLALVPSYLALRAASVSTPSSTNPSATLTQGASAAELSTARDLVNVLGPLTASTSTATYIIADALALKTSDITITHITFTGGVTGQTGTLVLQGTGVSPEAINTYQMALKTDPHFTNVTVPVSALVGTGSGAFTMTLSGTF